MKSLAWINLLLLETGPGGAWHDEARCGEAGPGMAGHGKGDDSSSIISGIII